MEDRLVMLNHKIRVTSVSLGSYGGYIFSGKPIQGGKTLVCKVPYQIATRSPATGEVWEITGQKVNSDEYNNYIDLIDCHPIEIKSVLTKELLRWHLLKHHRFRGFGLGKAKIDKLLGEHGIGAEALITLLNNNKWQHLTDLLSEHIAKSLCRNWQALKNHFETLQFLKENSIPLSVAKPLLKVCGYNTVSRLESNPYSLIAFYDIAPNIWHSIERTAAKLGIEQDDPRRLIGLVEYCLYEQLAMAHTACRREDIVAYLEKELGSYDAAINALKAALKKKAICHVTYKGSKYYQLSSIGYIEYEVEKEMRSLLEHPSQEDIFIDVNSSINVFKEEIYTRDGFYLTNAQLKAIKEAITNRLVIIDGYGGTGKTTILEGVVSVSKPETSYVLALAGKAKERAKQSIGEGAEAFTIHSFIEKVKSKKLAQNEKVRIIIDEASMVDILLIYRLIKSLKGIDYSLLLVGDRAQLSPVGVGLFFHRLVNSDNDKIKIIKLREVHRTKATGMLHKVSMGVRSGNLHKLEQWRGETEGVYLLPCDDQAQLFNRLLQVKQLMPNAQIVTAHVTESRKDSARLINNFIQSNIQTNQEVFMSLGETKIMKHDWVIVTQNLYDINLYNGNTGIVSSVYYSEEHGEICCNIVFDGKEISITKSTAWELGLQLAYAISTHKSQGSEYDTTVVCAIESSKLLDRSMFYTAITRSRKLTLVAGKLKVAINAVKKPNRFELLKSPFQI
jgi:exodeoxyribonuclease V alpha subunit